MPDMPPAGDGLMTYVFAGVATVVSTLAAVIGILYRSAETRNGRDLAELKERVNGLDEKLDKSEAERLECEKDRSALRGKCEVLERRVGYLEKAQST